MDGIYVHAVDAATGKTIWVNDTTEIRPARQIALLEVKLMIDGDNSSAVLEAACRIPSRRRLGGLIQVGPVCHRLHWLSPSLKT